MIERRYGWKPDIPDQRDYIFKVSFLNKYFGSLTLPTRVDLRSFCPPVWDQGNLGSCTAHAIAGIERFVAAKQKLPPFMPSRLFIYYNERLLEGTVNSDAGAFLRDGIKSLVIYGACPESKWWYNEVKFAVKPSKICYDLALTHQIITYRRVPQTLNSLKSCLSDGYPFVFGFAVYESFISPSVEQTGIVPMPGPSERLLGGHAVMAVGYSDMNQCFIVRNSWGKDWGDAGYFYLPYKYLTNQDLSADFWMISLTE